MKHMICAALLALIPVAACAGVALTTRVVSLDEMLSNPRLIGHAVEITACAGVSMSDAPDQRDVILLFRCGASPSEIVDDKKAAIGRVSVATVLEPAAKPPTGNSPLFRGRFRGVLRRGTPEEDWQDALVIDLSLVEIQSWVDEQGVDEQ